MLKKTVLTCSILICLSAAIAQNGVGFYYDYTKNFHVFDKGNDIQLESTPVNNIKTGNDYLTYLDQKSSFIYYFDGQKQILEENPPNKTIAIPSAIVYKMEQRLMICEKGQKKLLARNVDFFYADDSIIVWQEIPSKDIKVYENGKVQTMISAISSEVINDLKTGKNIIAYNDLNFDLNIFYKGKNYNTEVNRVTNYKCGNGIVAYLDSYKNTFNAFYNGEFKVLSKTIIKNYFVANNMIAFVDANDNFMIFYDGAITKIDSRSPDFFYTQNNILYYSYNSELKIIYAGEILTERLIPQQNIIPGYESILFYNTSNIPFYFYKGKVIDNFYVQRPFTVSLNMDLPIFRYGENTIGFFYNGKIYEYYTRSN
ncbi:MAG: hypothetical protein H0X46_04700 [Bacteroidetes bacterium]|nr:hypothetical protein [Bacteroidota bacterium]